MYNSSKQNKIYLIIISILIFINITLFVLFNNAYDTININYNSYLNSQEVKVRASLSKIIKNNSNNIKVFLYNDKTSYNIPYLVKGEYPKKGYVTILDKYAISNHLKIGDSYIINNKAYIISGYMYNPTYIFPFINYDSFRYDIKRNNIVYMDSIDFNNTKGISNNRVDSNDKVRIEMLKEDIMYNKNIIKVLLVMFSIIIMILTFTFTIKRIIDSKKDIKLFSILGYSNLKIIVTYNLYPLFLNLLATILGYIVGSILSISYINNFLNNYLLPLNYKNINLYLYLFLVPLILFILSLLVTFVNIKRKHKVPLINYIISNLKINIKYKIKYLLNFNKILIINLMCFSACLVFLFSILISLGIKIKIKEVYNDLNYKYLITYNKLQTSSDSDNNILEYKTSNYIFYGNNINKIVGSKNNKVGEEIYLNDARINIQKISNSNDNTIYINRKKLCNVLGIGDSYNIKYTNNNLYSNTNNIENIDDIDNIIDIKASKNSSLNTIKKNTNFIYIISLSSFIIFFITLYSLCFIIIEDNRNHLLLLSILGYSKNMIKKMVIDIYSISILINYMLAFIISKYLLSSYNIIDISNINYFFIVMYLVIIYLIYKLIIKFLYKKTDI